MWKRIEDNASRQNDRLKQYNVTLYFFQNRTQKNIKCWKGDFLPFDQNILYHFEYDGIDKAKK